MEYAASRRVRFLSFVAALTCGSTVAQGVALVAPKGVPASVAAGEPVRVELRGFVVDPAGAPVEGAVVVTSAGGKALTDRDGAYGFDVRVAPGTSVNVTAVAAHGLVASTSALVSSAAGSVQVPPLGLAFGSSCDPSWLPTFGGTGTSDSVAALAEFDSGDGPELHAAGRFLTAGGVAANRIARWDGTSWKPLGAGLSGEARALAVFDDGSGPALFVGGSFDEAGGTAAGRIAKWDGTSWTSVGGGITGSFTNVLALAVFDDGGGPALYAAGTFTAVGAVPANNIARWNGTSWSALGDGLSAGATSLVVHDDGSGPALFAGGSFFNAGGAAAPRIARWNGTSWSALGATAPNGTVYALAVYGGALYAGGTLASAGPVTLNGIGRWNGSSWSAVGGGLNSFAVVRALHAFDDGSGSKLWVGGRFVQAGSTAVNHLATWNGSSWQALGSGVEGGDGFPNLTEVLAFGTCDDGGGPALFVGGRFSDADGKDVNNVARRTGASFSGLGTGLSGSVRAVVQFDDGTGPALYAGGDFVTAQGVTLNHIGKWDGWSWTPLGSGMNGAVHALVVHDDGSGPALFAGGDFITAGGVTVSHVAKWDGTSWSELDRGVSQGGVRALAVHGGALYVGGTFLLAGGAFGTTPVNRIAKWDGTGWDELGTGINTQGGVVKALISYNDGNGPRLYAAGEFTSAGDIVVSSIAKWNGSFWARVGGDFTNPPVSIEALAVYGGGLIAAGRFDQAGGTWAGNIARWNGSNWFEVGSLQSAFNEIVLSLWVHDDGSGSKLYASGNAGITRWNGSSWTAVGGGALGRVLAMTTFDSGSGPSLFAGGQIFSFVDSGDSFLGEWGCDRLPPRISAHAVARRDDPANGPGEFVTFSVSADDDHDPAPLIWLSSESGSFFPPGVTQVFCVATDAAGNPAVVQFPVVVHPRIFAWGF